jgi:hypothetical protein
MLTTTQSLIKSKMKLKTQIELLSKAKDGNELLLIAQAILNSQNK